MTFKEVAIKNFKINIRKYFSFFLCSSFSIMIFFVYSTLLFNKDLANEQNYDMIIILFYISLTAVTIFSIFFINYAHSAFIKSRDKEFGVYLTLGMNSRDLQKIITIENLIIILSSLTVGIVSGLLFSRLFQMVVLKILGITQISYSFDYRSLVLTVAVFLVIFITVILSGNFITRKLDISDLIKKSRKKDKANNDSKVLGLVGIGTMIISLIMLIVICNNEQLRTHPLIVVMYFVVSFAGAYMTISYVGSSLLNLVKNSSYYFNNILSITQINHKFNQNKKIIFILSILSSMTITLVASPMSLYNLSTSIAEMNQVNNIEFVQLSGINNLSETELNSLLNKGKINPEKIMQTEFISLDIQGDYGQYDVIKSKPIVSQDTYNSITNSNIQLEKREALNIITVWQPGNHGIDPSSDITFSDGSKMFTFIVKDSIHSEWIANGESYKSSSGIVINNDDYNNMKNTIEPNRIGLYTGIKYSNWKGTKDIVDMLENQLSRKNEELPNDMKQLSAFFNVISTVKNYEDLKNGYSFFIFITLIMGLLFFIAGGSVLFFKQYTELNNDKVRFFKLYKIGISEKEAGKVIAKELRVTFFTPPIVGSLLGYCFIYYLTFLFGGGDIIKEFMLNVTYVVIVYFLFQAGFYLITKKKYTDEILSDL